MVFTLWFMPWPMMVFGRRFDASWSVHKASAVYTRNDVGLWESENFTIKWKIIFGNTNDGLANLMLDVFNERRHWFKFTNYTEFFTTDIDGELYPMSRTELPFEVQAF